MDGSKYTYTWGRPGGAAAAAAAMATVGGEEEAGIYPYFDPQGFWDVCLPAVLAMFALGALFKALERRLMGNSSSEAAAAAAEEAEDEAAGGRGKGGRRVTHVFCTGVVSRVLLLLLPWLPLGFLRTRWDWACTAPTVYETLAHLYHWHDTSAKLKWSLLGHHVVVLLVVWPLARLIEAEPYPVYALSMPLFFEVGSAWSYFSYIVKSRGPRVLDALGMQKVEAYAVPGLIWLCYWGQRAMRAAAIWEGIVFLNEHPQYSRARALQVVMIALEIHGAWRCVKHLPGFGDAYHRRRLRLAQQGSSSSSSGGGSGSAIPSSDGKSEQRADAKQQQQQHQQQPSKAAAPGPARTEPAKPLSKGGGKKKTSRNSRRFVASAATFVAPAASA